MRQGSRRLSPAFGTAFACRTFADPEEVAEWLSSTESLPGLEEQILDSTVGHSEDLI